jgi:transposase
VRLDGRKGRGSRGSRRRALLGRRRDRNLSAVDAVRLYKELSEVERAFADLKDVLDMRPIYHQTDNRVQAHIYVAALALLIQRLQRMNDRGV